MASKFRIAIVCVTNKRLIYRSHVQRRGAGIGGLMLACCIAQMDKRKKIELDIYEATAELAEIGAGINLWPRAFEILEKIGLEEDILKYCERANADSCSFSSSSDIYRSMVV